jgi:hypothetical protein
MKKFIYSIIFLLVFGGVATEVHAGNPDRQGEAGAYELLMIPYARMAGLHAMTTANVSGVEAIRLNPAGLSRINQTELSFSSGNYLSGTGISMSSFGVARKIGKGGAFGISLMALDFGDIPVTTTDQPEGVGTTFSPSFFNLGFSYAHTFENKVTVGITLRGVSESTADINAFAFAIDAGVQYVTGEDDNFKFGISLRNVGGKMKFSGEALNTLSNVEAGHEITLSQRPAGYELPSMLNIGASYDVLFGTTGRLTVLGNFTSNSFSRDQIGGGMEFSLKEIFMVRAGYKYEFVGNQTEGQSPLYSGLSAGATVALPLSKENKNTRVSIDYAYRQTKIFNGTHNIGVRFNM